MGQRNLTPFASTCQFCSSSGPPCWPLSLCLRRQAAGTAKAPGDHSTDVPRYLRVGASLPSCRGGLAHHRPIPLCLSLLRSFQWLPYRIKLNLAGITSGSSPIYAQLNFPNSLPTFISCSQAALSCSPLSEHTVPFLASAASTWHVTLAPLSSSDILRPASYVTSSVKPPTVLG